MAGKLKPSQMAAFVLSLSATISNECNVRQKRVLKDLDKLTKERRCDVDENAAASLALDAEYS